VQSTHFKEILSRLERREDRFVGHFGGYLLESVFQPIFSLFHCRTGGAEALVRGIAPDGRQVSAMEILSLPGKNGGDRVFLDRLLRSLHLANLSLRPKEKQWLFLNLDPYAAVAGREYGSFFEDILSHFSVLPSQVVVEILESGIDDEKLLSEAGGYYRQIGCLLAIDDFGAGHSNFDRIWSFKPDLVKVDRSMIRGAAENKRIRRLLPGIVSLLRESGALVVLEGVETEEEARVVFETEADFVQGFYFARPGPVFSGITQLSDKRMDETLFLSMQSNRDENLVLNIAESLLSFAGRMPSINHLEADVLDTFSHFGVIRFYMLDGQGFQRGETITLREVQNFCDSRFDPIQDAKGANWARRGYFQSAISHKGVTQISPPYLSLTGAHLCRTVSLAVESSSEVVVFCVDVDWSDSSG
jgi:EAL domain-containing protein (putative c-di-GMP-specific phosphodiesterase class I)